MQIKAIVYHKNTWKDLSVEACLVPGLPIIEILGIGSSLEKRIRAKLKIWLRQHQIYFPRNKRILIHLSKDLRGEVLGLELAIWLSLLSLHTRSPLQSKRHRVFGDYDLKAHALDQPDLIKQLRKQKLSLYTKEILPRDMLEYSRLSGQSVKESPTTLKYLLLNFTEVEQANLLAIIQTKEQKILERLNRYHQEPAARVGKIIYSYLKVSSSMKRLEEILLSEAQSFVLFSQLCPCGETSVAKKNKKPCAYTKAECQSCLAQIKLLPLASFDFILDRNQGSGVELSDLYTKEKLHISEANGLLMQYRHGLTLK